jgi:hypothetical protein
MTWVILVAFLIVVALMTLSGRKQVGWMNKMHRINAGVARKAEWMAPDDIVKMVQEDYLAAVRWLPESMLQEWSQQWNSAPYYLSGLYLKRHQEILKHYQMGRPPRYTGILRCVHEVEVRQFSDDGERCLIIDHQTDRRMATYDFWTQSRVNTQDLGDSTVVYEMAYDKQVKRWKIDRFVQDLPAGWRTGGQLKRVHLLSALPPVSGRDN